MARKRGPGNYKKINSLTKNFGSAGAQILIARFKKADAQSSQVTWLNNVNVTGMLQEGDGDAGGILFYLTTGASFDDDQIISCKGFPGYGGSVSLSAKRRIRKNEESDLGDQGQVYLYGEITDLSYTADVQVRTIIETWGRNVNIDEL